MLRPLTVYTGLLSLLSAQQFVADTDPSPAVTISSSVALPIADLVGWFRAYDGTAPGLYRTDGSPGGTQRVIDGWLTPRHAVGSHALFTTTNDTNTGTGLFVTDGTAAGTAQLLPTVVETIVLGAANGRLILADDRGFAGGYTFRIYSTDLTPGGTTLLATVSDLRGSVELNNEVLLLCSGSGLGQSMHATDGTTFAERHVFGNSESPTFVTAQVLGGEAFFLNGEFSGAPVDQLWKTDGTTTGLVVALGPTASRRMGRAGNTLLITGDQGSTTTLSSDGTAAGTGVMTNQVRGFTFRTLGNRAVFAGFEPVHGGELWSTDGTSSGTALLLDATPGALSSDLSQLSSSTNRAWCFLGSNQLLTTDGTVAGTQLLPTPVTAAANSGGMAILGDTALVVAPIGLTSELLAIDGTTAAAVPLTGNSLRKGLSGAFAATPLLDQLFFVADHALHGRELWRTDGTAAGTVLVEDVAPGPANAVGEVVAMGGELWFGVGGALYRSDGTAAGRTLVHDTGSARLHRLRAGDGVLSFFTEEGSFIPQRRLWRSDGVTTVQSPLLLTLRAEFLQLGDTTYHVSQTQGSRLFRWDGDTTGGTDLGFADRLLGRLGERVLFLASNELRITDGTLTGTSTIGFLPATFDQAVANRRDHATFFVLLDTANGVYATDGTTLVTLPVPRRPSHLAGGNDLVLMQTVDGASGQTLWRTDGTIAGTQFVADFGALSNSGTIGMWPLGSGNRVLLSVLTDNDGVEPWISDGTAAGTMQLADLNPTGSSDPKLLGTAADVAYLVADDGVTGPELWRLDLDAVGAANVQPLGIGCPGTPGMPHLDSGDTPQLAASFTMQLSNALPTTIALWFVGHDLGFLPLGGGCNLYFQQLLGTFWNVTDVSGAASATLAIPASPALLGAGLITQVGVFDPLGASPFGTATSPGLLAVIGN